MCGITDASGNLIATYKYDEWGNLLAIETAEADNAQQLAIAEANPFRYRSYYYDAETGYYYLQSRYYDADICRFVNADAVKFSGETGSAASYNLLLYCENNPIHLIDVDGCQPEWAGAICKKAKNTKVYKAFVYATQHGWFKELFYLAGFVRDSKGIYHARQNCWQQIAGYNDIYDWAFNLGTSMMRGKFPFKYKQKSYIFWAWKGDYLNLGAGAELGIYYGGKQGHWLVNKKIAMKMSLTLKFKGKTIVKYNPGKVWWLTGFNPYYQNVKAKELVAIYTIDFSTNKGMFNAFYKKYRWASGWKFNTKKHTATYTF